MISAFFQFILSFCFAFDINSILSFFNDSISLYKTQELIKTSFSLILILIHNILLIIRDK